MKKLIIVVVLIVSVLSLAACARAQWQPLFDYGDMTRPPTPTPTPAPTPDPNKLFANNPEAVDEPNVIIYKQRHVLELYDGKTLVARLQVSLGTTPKGKKTANGDGRTPEGNYVICFRNPNSKFYKSLVVNYPNEQDADEALDDGAISQKEHDNIVSAADSGLRPPWNTALGGEIAICGYGTEDAGKTGDWTSGNVAVSNTDMDYLWQYVQMDTPVVIKP